MNRRKLSQYGARGARALYESLTPRQREFKARRAAKARWAAYRASVTEPAQAS